jgi:cation transport ATPase
MLEEGWIITLANGEILQVIQQRQAADQIPKFHHTPLEIRRGKTVLGYVELSTHACDRWHAVFEALHEMEIDVHIVGSESYSRMHDLVKPLRMNHKDNLHGNFHANDRLELVKKLQKEDGIVAYVGYVLDDFPAMIQAEVSIGIEIDSDSIFTSGISDVSIGPDVSWLPRLIMLCKRHQKTVKRNFALISGSNFLAVVAAAASLISPAAMILFADIPLLLAELLSIKAMDSHGVFESNVKSSRTSNGLANRRLSCRLPKGGSRQTH